MNSNAYLRTFQSTEKREKGEINYESVLYTFSLLVFENRFSRLNMPKNGTLQFYDFFIITFITPIITFTFLWLFYDVFVTSMLNIVAIEKKFYSLKSLFDHNVNNDALSGGLRRNIIRRMRRVILAKWSTIFDGF